MNQVSPVKIFHFHNGKGGGVLSVIKNLLAFRQHPKIENNVIYTINREQISEFKIPGLVGAASEQIFYYSPKWNFYHICRKLAKLLPDENAVIVAHDWLELGMVSNLGLQNPVVHYVHGAYDYYYNLAIRHSPWIDTYITVAKNITDELVLRLPERKEKIHYLRFPVPDISCETAKKPPGFHIVFASRCDETKGYTLLPNIERELRRLGLRVKWHIAGEGSLVRTNQAIWPSNCDIHFYGNLANDDLMQIFCSSHAFILPSKAEGMPVAVVEAMKAGMIPVVNDLQGGIKELIMHGINGFRVKNNLVCKYASLIKELYSDETRREKISVAAKEYATAQFDPLVNTALIELKVLNLEKTPGKKKGKKVYGSRLDCSMIPNSLTYLLRGIYRYEVY